jgi:hypothetical protein
MTPGEFGSFIGVILKCMVVFASILYSLFAFIIVRQEQLMAKVFVDTTEPLVRLITYIHLVASVSLIFLSLAFL